MHYMYVCRLLSDTSQGLGDDFAVPEGMVEVTLTEVVRSSKRVITGARDFRLNAQDDVRPLLFAVDIAAVAVAGAGAGGGGGAAAAAGAAVCFRLLLLLLLLLLLTRLTTVRWLVCFNRRRCSASTTRPARRCTPSSLTSRWTKTSTMSTRSIRWMDSSMSSLSSKA
eukprot:COSAG06_NODE_519_length_14752_cov_130.649840_5_plen_167_part_00